MTAERERMAADLRAFAVELARLGKRLRYVQARQLDDATVDVIIHGLVEGLAPALKIIVDQLTKWFEGHRADIKEWAASLGKKLPDAFHAVVDAIGGVVDTIKPFVDSATKLKVLAVGLAAVFVGPLVYAIGALGIALMSTPVGWIMAAIALIAAGVYEIYKHWDGIKAWFAELWDDVKLAFSMFWDWIKGVFFKYTPLGLIIKNWGAITGFFGGLWDGVTAVFKRAWDFIENIVDKVLWAVNKVKAAANYLNPFSDDDSGQGAGLGQMMANQVIGQARAAVAGGPVATSAKVTIDINAPKGTRATIDPRSTADVDTSMGLQMVGAQ